MEDQPTPNRRAAHKPINFDFYDELEAAASLNQSCEITYRDDSGEEQYVISPINDIYTEHGVEYVRLDNKLIVRLEQITSVNGKTEKSHGEVDTDLLQSTVGEPYTHKDTMDSGTPGTQFATEFEAEPMAFNPSHATDRLQKNEDTTATAYNTQLVNPAEAIQRDETSDFAHRFVTSVGPFLIAENKYYRLVASRFHNRLYLTANAVWEDIDAVPELGSYFARIAPLMSEGFTLLNDLTVLTPDMNGTLMAPAVPNRSVLFRAGLAKVADLVPDSCETLVHGTESFSVNSVPLRYFKNRDQAENWLTDFRPETEEGRFTQTNEL
jgi:Rho-binding antiterminator